MAGVRTRGVRREFVFPWKKFACACLLFIVGLIFSIFGLVRQELAFGIVGIIAILPGGYQLLLIVQTARGVRGYRVEEVYEEVVMEEGGPAPDDIAVHAGQPSYLDEAVDDLEAGFVGQDSGAQGGVGGWTTSLPIGSSLSAPGHPAHDTDAALAAADATGIDLHVERFTGQEEEDDLALVEDGDTVV